MSADHGVLTLRGVNKKKGANTVGETFYGFNYTDQ